MIRGNILVCKPFWESKPATIGKAHRTEILGPQLIDKVDNKI